MYVKRFIPYALVFPICTLYILLIGGGLIETVKESLGYIPALGLNTVSFLWYREVLGQQHFLRDMLYSVYLAATATIVSTLFGIFISYAFVTTKNGFIKSIVKKALQAGLIIPYLYVVFLALQFLSQTGFISRLLYHMGFVKDFTRFPALVFDRTGFAMIWVFVFKGTPFIALFTLHIMSKISHAYGDVAASLGAGGLNILRRIYIPLSARTIVWSSCIVFAYALGSFEVPYLLGSLSPVPLSSRLYSLFIHVDLGVIPRAMALNVILLGLGGILIGLYAVLLKFILRGRLS